MVFHGVQNEITLYAAPRKALKGAATPWRKVADIEDAVTSFAARGEDVYLLTHRGAPRFKILRTRAGAPDLARAAEVLPPGRPVVQRIYPAKDALYAQELEGGLARLRRIRYGGEWG